jgi:predicted secreted protein
VLSEPTVGARWRLREGQSDIEVVESSLTPAAWGATGAAASRRFRVRSRAAGHQQIAFELMRSWQQTPLLTYIEEVEVCDRKGSTR